MAIYFENRLKEELLVLNYPDHCENNYIDLKEWLWDKYRIYIKVEVVDWKNNFHWAAYKCGSGFIASKVGEQKQHPIDAEIEGIKQVVSFLAVTAKNNGA